MTIRFTRQADLSDKVFFLYARRGTCNALINLEAAEVRSTTNGHAPHSVIDLIHHVFFICKRGRSLGIYLACQARVTNVGAVLHLMQPGFGYHSQPSKETTANAAFNILQKAVMRLSVAAFEVDA